MDSLSRLKLKYQLQSQQRSQEKPPPNSPSTISKSNPESAYPYSKQLFICWWKWRLLHPYFQEYECHLISNGPYAFIKGPDRYLFGKSDSDPLALELILLHLPDTNEKLEKITRLLHTAAYTMPNEFILELKEWIREYRISHTRPA